MAKTIYSQIDGLTLTRSSIRHPERYAAIGELGLIDGLSKDDIVEGFPISLEATFNGKTIVKNLTCVYVEQLGGKYEGNIAGDFFDVDDPELVESMGSVALGLYFPVSSQGYVDQIVMLKDLPESVFGQPSSEVVDDETTYYYEPVKIVIGSVEEDPFAKFVKNYSDKDAPEVKAPMFDELKKYLITKHEISEEESKDVFADCYSVVDLLNAICNYVEAHKNAGT